MYRERGAFLEKTHGNEFTRSGMPDLVGCFRGHYIALEAKRRGNKATPLQEYALSEIRAAGGIAIVVWSVKEALDVLDAIDRAEDGS